LQTPPLVVRGIRSNLCTTMARTRRGSLLRDEQKATGRPFKSVVNDLLREVRQRWLEERRNGTQAGGGS